MVIFVVFLNYEKDLEGEILFLKVSLLKWKIFGVG